MYIYIRMYIYIHTHIIYLSIRHLGNEGKRNMGGSIYSDKCRYIHIHTYIHT